MKNEYMQSKEMKRWNQLTREMAEILKELQDANCAASLRAVKAKARTAIVEYGDLTVWDDMRHGFQN